MTEPLKPPDKEADDLRRNPLGLAPEQLDEQRRILGEIADELERGLK